MTLEQIVRNILTQSVKDEIVVFDFDERFMSAHTPNELTNADVASLVEMLREDLDRLLEGGKCSPGVC